MTRLPSGTLSFLLTDIEGSTRKWEGDQREMARALRQHDAILRAAIESQGGYVFKTVGDAFCAAFQDPRSALKAALEAQSGLAAQAWVISGGIIVRMAIHSGTTEERDGDFFGPVLNRCARILSLVNGGQIVCSLASFELLVDHLPADCELSPLGLFRLKDLSRPERLFQVCAPGLRVSFPSLPSLDGKPHNLPLQPTLFVGREPEVEAIRSAFAPGLSGQGDAARGGGACRLLTIIGSGGAGKTRLALQSGAELVDAAAGGVWFIDLSNCRNAADTARTVNRVLVVKEREGRSPAEALKDYVGDRRILLIFDNLEQDMASGSLIGELLESCPGLAILGTSREALGIRWERTLPLAPLALPDLALPRTAHRIGQYEAVALFIERATVARPGFAVNEANAPPIAEICVRLEGIPLAIELAAARVRSFSPHEILKRLGEDLGFLESEVADLPARHRTLRAAAQWSYGLLSVRERSGFRSLGVFAGSFSLESAEVLLRPLSGGKRASRGVGNLIASLVDKSLIFREEGEAETRYRMLETLRAFARERLEASGEAAAVWELHSRRFLELAECGRGSGGSRCGEVEYFGGIDREYPDYIAAYEDFIATGQCGSALRLACGLGSYWENRGMLEEGIERLRAALSRSDEGTVKECGTVALEWLGDLHRARGEYAESLAAFEGLRNMAQDAARPRDLARSRIGTGWTQYRQGEARGARESFEAAMEAARESGDPILIARAKHGLGTTSLIEGRLDLARDLLLAATREFEAEGRMATASRALTNLGVAMARSGDFDSARANLRHALELAAAVGDREAILHAANNLGCFYAQTGDHEAALEQLSDFETSARALGWPRFIALALSSQAESLLALGRLDEALDRVTEAQRLASPLSSRTEQGWCMRILAEVHEARRDYGQALARLGEAETIFSQLRDADELARARELRTRIEAAGKADPIKSQDPEWREK